MSGVRERDIIRDFFAFESGAGVEVGVGDDAAVLLPPSGARLAVSTDTLIAGVHFFADEPPYYVARKAAAVSLSDIAATGARPLWLTAALSAPAAPRAWFAEFARGLRASAAEYGYAVVGGDLTRAETLAVTTTLIGACHAAPLTRAAAVAGDDIWLSGDIGGAAHAVAARRGDLPAAADMTAANHRLRDPAPRLPLARAVAGVAHAAMDLSDGLVAAARAVGEMSGVCMRLNIDAIPPSPSLAVLDEAARRRCLLAGGDDYELLFTAPAKSRGKIAALATADVPLTRIGAAASGGGGARLFCRGEEITFDDGGYEHDFGV